VGVDDPRPGAAHGVADVRRIQAAAQQAGRRAGPPQRRGVALEQLGVLAQVLAGQPGQVLDRPLLPAGGAVPVVQEEDHGRVES
jgi:hypothetical protein